jgi:hypothetical protein
MENPYSKWSRERLKRIGVINRFIDGSISRAEASRLVGISERQVTRITKEVNDLGDGAHLHKNTGNANAATISGEVKEKVLEIFSWPEYENVNFLHFRDSLLERHGISIPYASLVSILKNAGNESPKKKKKRQSHRRRKRKEHEGELLQIDASPFDWLRTGEMLSLHGLIDDATGEPKGLYLCKNECRLGYFEATRQCILTDGVPLSLYSDRHTIFRSPKHGQLTANEPIGIEEVSLTQFGRAMHELGVNIIYARSPQAKGRVERMWETLQSRLPVEFALDGIRDIESANKYLKDRIIPYCVERWGVGPADGPIFVPLREDVDIDTILCVVESRRTDNAGAFSFHGRAFQVVSKGFPLIPKGQEIEVLTGLRIGIKARYRGQLFDAVRYIRPERKAAPKTLPRAKAEAVKPHLHISSPEWKQVWHYESYNLTLRFLYDLFLSDEDIFKDKNLAERNGG